jgi:hypothetical protein
MHINLGLKQLKQLIDYNSFSKRREAMKGIKLSITVIPSDINLY